MFPDTTPHNTQIDDDLRDAQVLEDARQAGILPQEIVHCGKAIAKRAARLFAKSSQAPTGDEMIPHSAHVPPLLAFDGEAVDGEVRLAIGAIAELPGKVPSSELVAIAKLVEYHARYSQTAPAGFTPAIWLKELSNIAADLLRTFYDAERSVDATAHSHALRNNCMRLAIALPHLRA